MPSSLVGGRRALGDVAGVNVGLASDGFVMHIPDEDGTQVDYRRRDAIEGVQEQTTMTSTAMHIYTSGTTGLPKAARIHHIKVIGSGVAMPTFYLSPSEYTNERFYISMPLFHSAAMLVGIASTVMMASTVYMGTLSHHHPLNHHQGYLQGLRRHNPRLATRHSRLTIRDPQPTTRDSPLSTHGPRPTTHDSRPKRLTVHGPTPLTAPTLGGTVVLRDKFSRSNFWKDCREHNVTTIQYIGELLRYLVNAPPGPDDKAHSVRLALGNGLRNTPQDNALISALIKSKK